MEVISPFGSIQRKHHDGPLLAEREQYLSHLIKEGAGRSEVRSTASYLLHVIRILELSELRIVTEVEISEAGQFWAQYRGPHRQKQYIPGAPGVFIRIARSWLLFHGKIAPPAPPPFQELIAKFSEALRSGRGLAPTSVMGYSARAHGFLKWFAGQNREFRSVSIFDVDAYLAVKRAVGWTPRGMATQCQAMRTFFGYAERQGWCQPGIPLGIRSPRIPKYDSHPKGPTWTEVRKILKSADGENPIDLRTKAILLLLSIYGLRSSEVTGLRLDDFDWRSETLTVRRAKRGGIQHYPIQYEVGEAILAYLQRGRPKCVSRFVFVSSCRPYGRLGPSPMWQAVGKRMRDLGICLHHVGPHALRHACATRLLQKGSSLKEIAEFLGHRDTKSVGIYARYDTASLRKVAAFRLNGL
jgi:site-specific recombinase XerD